VSAPTELKRGDTIQVGKTGVLSPVAELEPVVLAGSTISRATLHNEDEIRRKDIRVGDLVEIEKAGEVIPAVLRSFPEERPAGATEFSIQEAVGGKCPVCGSLIAKVEVAGEEAEGVAWRCTNYDCKAQRAGRLGFFCSRGALAIEGLDRSAEEGNGLLPRVDVGQLHGVQVGGRDVERLVRRVERHVEEPGLGRGRDDLEGRVDGRTEVDISRRLTMYKLRAQVTVANVSRDVSAVWDMTAFSSDLPDPRFPEFELGWRDYAAFPVDFPDGAESYEARRLKLGCSVRRSARCSRWGRALLPPPVRLRCPTTARSRWRGAAPGSRGRATPSRRTTTPRR